MRNPIARAVHIFLLQPLWTALLLYFWKHELPDKGTIVGGALIFAGVVVIILTRVPNPEQVASRNGKPSLVEASSEFESFRSEYRTFRGT